MRVKILIKSENKNWPREISFDSNLDKKSNKKEDLPKVLRELANLLEAPVVEDKEIF